MQYTYITLIALPILFLIFHIYREYLTLTRELDASIDKRIDEKFDRHVSPQNSEERRQLFIADSLLGEIKKKLLLRIIDGMPPIGGATLELSEEDVGRLWVYFDTYHPEPVCGDMIGFHPSDIKFRMGTHHKNS